MARILSRSNDVSVDIGAEVSWIESGTREARSSGGRDLG